MSRDSQALPLMVQKAPRTSATPLVEDISQTAPTAAIRKYQPSRVLAQMENATKKYPKFFHPNEVQSVDDSREWEYVDEEDPDVFVIANDVDEGFVDMADTAERASPYRREREEKSEVCVIAAPISDSLFEELVSSGPTETGRTSARPTLPLGPPAVMVIPDQDVQAQTFEALLARPSQVLAAYTPAQPSPLLASVIAQPKRSWGVPVAAMAAVLAAGLAIFGGVHVARSYNIALHSPSTTVQVENVAVMRNAPQREAEHSERAEITPPEVTPVRLAMGGVSAKSAATPAVEATDTKAATKPSLTGPSKARMALAAGDLETASGVFEELAENPSTKMDGLVGLAEVSRARGDLSGAQARYRDILVQSPIYFPAKLGLADTTWDLGDHEGARKMYQGMESYPAAMVPARATERAK